MCDINDEMIDVHTSLMVGIALEISTRYYELNSNKDQVIGILS